MFEDVEMIDLTHTVDEMIPSWSGACPFSYEVKRDYEEGIRVLKYKMHASCGTHIDAPSHFFPDGKHVSMLKVENLVGPFVKIDLSPRCSSELRLRKQDILEFEKNHGSIEPGTFVIFASGWERFFSMPELYRSSNSKGSMEFPTVEENAAKYLITKEISGLGIDTLSPDPSDGNHPVHRLLLSKGKYIVENLCQLSTLPSTGGYIAILPLKIKEGSEAPARCIAFVKRN